MQKDYKTDKDKIEILYYSDDKQDQQNYIDSNSISISDKPTSGLQRYLRRHNKTIKLQLSI